MTATEIRSLIEQTIEGQGSAIDIGGGLPKILKGICDLIEGGEPLKIVPLSYDDQRGVYRISEDNYNRALQAAAIVFENNEYHRVTDWQTLMAVSAENASKAQQGYDPVSCAVFAARLAFYADTEGYTPDDDRLYDYELCVVLYTSSPLGKEFLAYETTREQE